jgi:putative ABC transport system permease protein
MLGGSETWREVVGVVGDTKHWGLGHAVNPEMYLPIAQQVTPFMTLVIRTRGEPLAMVNAVGEQVRALDPQLTVSKPVSMDEVIARSESHRTFFLSMLASFAGLALTLAGLGIYAVMAYSVTQRTHEIGVRMALGAQARDVGRLVLSEGVRMAIVGVILGIGGALALTRFLEKLLFDVTTTDPLTFVVVPMVLVLVALVACWMPARRAADVDPQVALRYE